MDNSSAYYLNRIKSLEADVVESAQLLDGMTKLLTAIIVEYGPITIENKTLVDLPSDVVIASDFDVTVGATTYSLLNRETGS